MPDTYDHITLLCRLKAAQRRNKELESGERYIQLEELHQKEYNVYEHKIEKLKKELADAHKETIRVRNYWFQVLEDMLREFEKAQKRSAQELRKMEIRALNAKSKEMMHWIKQPFSDISFMKRHPDWKKNRERI